jgi:CelD/BcsL family acetyltransferase involved in cellulose biosynthesis
MVELCLADGDLWAELDELADRIDAGPFVRPGWIRAWLRAFGGSDRLRLVAVRRGGQLVAAIPMLRPRRGVLVSPTNWHTPVYGPVVADAAAAAELARGLVLHASSILDVGFVDPTDQFALALTDAARAARRFTVQQPLLRSPYVALDGDFADYERALSSKFVREARRRRRKLDALGEVSIAFEDGADQLDQWLSEGFAVEGSGWKTRQGTAIASSATTDAFYREIAGWAHAQGWLQLGFLRLDGSCIAFLLSIVHGEAVNVVKVGFDPDFRRYAPGTQLTRAAIERAFELGSSRYDFLGSDDAYKLDWTDAVRERVRLQAFGRTPYGLRAYANQRWRPRLAAAVKKARERRR